MIILLLYRLVRFILLPLSFVIIIIRSLKGKEILARIKEKFGYASIIRPSGKIIWCHAASIGEAKSAITLLEQIHVRWPHYKFLLTTGTTTSAKIVANHFATQNHNNPKYFHHQFIPVDEYFAIKRFLKYWKPACIIFLESELWPNMLCAAKNLAPIILANARISSRSFQRWQKIPSFTQHTLQNFAQIIAQSQHDATMFKKLGASNVTTGPNLKLFNAKLATENTHIHALKQQTKKRPVICLASSHKGDDSIIISLYLKLKAQHKDLLCVIVPRHLNRTTQIISLITQHNLNYILRSSEDRIEQHTDIYLVDSLGELGNIFSISDITIIGGSFKNGGHNPLEPAYFSNIILWGPDMSNFALLAEQMRKESAAFECHSTDDLYKKIDDILNLTPTQIIKYKEAANQFIESHIKQQDVYCNLLKPYLDNVKT